MASLMTDRVAGRRRAGEETVGDFRRLWRFYVRAGFVYPAKMQKLSPHFPEVQDTMCRLLGAGPDVCRFFVREKEGEIKSSVAVVRLYERTWLLQHMASLADPFGMRNLLLRAVSWMSRNPEVDYGMLCWRPDNRAANGMFSGLLRELPGTDTGASVSEPFDYYFMGAGRLAAGLRAVEGEVHVSVLLSADLRRASELLWSRLGPTICRVYSLDPSNLALEGLQERYAANGLNRERRVFMACRGGEPVGIALADFSSLGMNFSYLLNTYRIHLLEERLPVGIRREVFHKLLRAVCAYYKAMGRDFVVGLCPPAHRDIYQDLGYEPLKQYLCLAASARIDSEATLCHLDGYYRTRLRDRRGQRAQNPAGQGQARRKVR